MSRSINIPLLLGCPSYIHQDRTSNCGPIAIYNSMLYLGIDPACIDIYKIEAGVKCSAAWGTGKSKITAFLRKMKIDFSQISKPKIRDIEDALYEGFGVIYLYRVNKESAHYVFFYGQTRHHFMVANDVGEKDNIPMFRRKKTYYSAKAKKLPVSLKFKRYGTYPHGWVIRGIKGITPSVPVEKDKEEGGFTWFECYSNHRLEQNILKSIVIPGKEEEND